MRHRGFPAILFQRTFSTIPFKFVVLAICLAAAPAAIPLAAQSVPRERQDPALQRQLEAAIRGCNGKVSDYVFAVLTREPADTSYAASNEGYALLKSKPTEE